MENLRQTLARIGVPDDRFDDVLSAVKQDRFIPYERFEEINRQKKELEAARTELEQQLEGFNLRGGGAEALSARVAELETLLEQQRGDFDGRISEREKGFYSELLELSLCRALNDAGAKNHAAVRALMDLSDVCDTEKPCAAELPGRLARAIACLREEHPYLFEKSGVAPGFRIGGEAVYGKGAAPKSNVTKAFGN